MMLFKDDFEKISDEKFDKLKYNAKNTNNLYYYSNLTSYEIYTYNKAKKYEKRNESKRRTSKPKNGYSPSNGSLYKKIEYLTQISKKYTFNNYIEKEIFKANALFPDDEKFILFLKNSLGFYLIDNLLNNLTYFDNLNCENKDLQRKIYLNIYIKQNKVEFQNLITYFLKFHNIYDLDVIINRASQIFYKNKDLYNEYTNNIKKPLTKTR